MDSEKSLKNLISVILIELFIVAFVVWFFDIFYQYHSPFMGIDPVFNDHDNQMPGSVRNLEYDSVLVGTSTAENYNMDVFDAYTGCNSIKIIKASGTTPDMLYYLKMSDEKHNLKYVYWNLDLFALDNDEGIRLFDEGADKYLQTKSVLDDMPYLFNKDILMERIPAYIVMSYKGINTGGNAYDWSKGKEFSTSMLMSNYSREYIAKEDIVELTEDEYASMIDNNLQDIAVYVTEHPDTEFIFVLPAYSLFWWDGMYVNGYMGMRMYSVQRIFDTFMPMDNAKVYCFCQEEDIVFNTNNYMDVIHYSPEVNDYMMNAVINNENEVTYDNYESYIQRISEMVDKIESEEIYKYYDLPRP